jgi:hypothetical protein
MMFNSTSELSPSKFKEICIFSDTHPLVAKLAFLCDENEVHFAIGNHFFNGLILWLYNILFYGIKGYCIF